MVPAAPRPAARVTPMVQVMLDGFTAGPAWVHNDYFAEAVAAKLRIESAAHAAAPVLSSLVEELHERSGLFRCQCAGAEVSLFRNGVKSFRHPTAGRLDLHFETRSVKSLPGLMLSLYLPVDAASTGRIAALRRHTDRAEH